MSQEIEEGKHRVIVTNVENIMKHGGGFEKLLKKKSFISKLISVVWDEAHCVSKWGGFRPDYKDANRLRYLIPHSVPFLLASATLPSLVLDNTLEILQARAAQTKILSRSNDRPNVHLVVRKMVYPCNSFHDLAFLVPDNLQPGAPVPKFLVFFDNISDSVEAAKYLRNRLPLEYRDKITWFNSDMSSEFRSDETAKLKSGLTYGLFCTDSFGMVRLTLIYHDKG
jgi:superfamily II DNA helicase RecQ